MASEAVASGKMELLGNDNTPSTSGAFQKEKKKNMFDNIYHLAAEQAVGLDNTYITDMSVKDWETHIQIAVALTNKSCMVYSFSNNHFRCLANLDGHDEAISNVKLSPRLENLVYTGSQDGSIKLWDLRTHSCVKELKDERGIKSFTSFDVSCDDRIICAGTEVDEGDAFVMFWDIRTKVLLGGYWESHTDDITQIAFHPRKKDFVATGSTDGLINLFDITKTSEEDALQHSLNTESSVAKIRWQGYSHLSCITHTEAMQIWSVEGAGPEIHFTKENVAENIESSNVNDNYMIDVYRSSNDELYLLAGATVDNGEIVKMFSIEKDKLLPCSEFVGNRQVVRCSSYVEDSKMLFTAGESGCISLWKPGQAVEKSGSGLKNVSKSRDKQKPKPY